MIDYNDVEIAFEFINFAPSGENEAYVNVQTGKTYWVSGLGDNEFGDDDEAFPDDIDDNDKYAALPHKNDLDLGKVLVLAFSTQFLSEDIDKIKSIFRIKWRVCQI
ncbi:MAG: hypothetical protein COB30_013540 [Ectothiorhodospiraceae bacterium]|nr:hypothetical protein [Ectothiorhodospiraceae bacterium]